MTQTHEERFVSAGMASLSVNELVMERGVSIQAVRLLKKAGVETAFDLQSYDFGAEIPESEKHRMLAWCWRRRTQFATHYRLGFREPDRRYLGL